MSGVEMPDPDMGQTLAQASQEDLARALVIKSDIAFVAYGTYDLTVPGKVAQHNLAGGKAIGDGRANQENILILLNNTTYYMAGKCLENGASLDRIASILASPRSATEFSDNLARYVKRMRGLN